MYKKSCHTYVNWKLFLTKCTCFKLSKTAKKSTNRVSIKISLVKYSIQPWSQKLKTDGKVAQNNKKNLQILMNYFESCDVLFVTFQTVSQQLLSIKWWGVKATKDQCSHHKFIIWWLSKYQERHLLFRMELFFLLGVQKVKFAPFCIGIYIFPTHDNLLQQLQVTE